VREEQIKNLLQQADEAVGAAAFRRPDTGEIRRRVRRRQRMKFALPIAAVLLLGAVVWSLCQRDKPPMPSEQRLATMEAQIEQLQAQTEEVLKLVHEVLQKDKQERRLAALEAELARIGDPAGEVEQQVDRTAFVMLYQADRLYKQLRRTESAVEAYKEIIQLFPENQWAEVARERLSEIKKHRINKSQTQGERKCERRSV
jgi:hypothetical protein